MDQISDTTAGSMLIDADDIDQAEEQISANYVAIRIKIVTPGLSNSLRVWRSYVGTLGLDEVEYTYDLTFDMDPLNEILLCRVLSGVFEETHFRQPTHRHGPGAAVAFGAIEDPLAGRLEMARFSMLGVPRRSLAQVTGDHPDGEGVRLTSATPRSDAANQHLVDVIDHIRHGVLSNPSAAQEPLVASAISQYLVASMVAAFPHTDGLRQVSDVDNYDALRRATAYIDDNAHNDISLADVAHAARVSAPALEAIFARHRNCSPPQYLRQARLAHAHWDLAAANAQTNTVAGIARKWGFWSLGPFNSLYRRTYGETPEATLNQ